MKVLVVVSVAVVGAAMATLSLARAGRSFLRVDRGAVWMDTVKRGALLCEVQGTGILVPEHVRWLTATVSARVAAVRERSGTSVEATTVVVVLDNPDLVLQALEADRQVTGAEADLVNMEARLRNEHLAQQEALVGLTADAADAERRAQADDELARRGLLSRLEMAQSRGRAGSLAERARIEARRLGAHDEQSRAEETSQRAQIERLRSIATFRHKELEHLEVRAGVAGVLEDVRAEVGQWVTPGTTLGRVGQADHLKAEIRIAETQAKDVRVGQRVTVDTHNGTAPGVVDRIDGAVQGGTVKVDVLLESLPAGARPDLSVDGRIEIERLANVLTVGRPALATPGSTMMLFKVEGDDAVRVPVQIGRLSVKTMEIAAGLNEGDTVVLSETSTWGSADRLRLE